MRHLKLVATTAPRRPMPADGVLASADAMLTTLGPADARRVARAILARTSAPSELVALIDLAVESVDEVASHPDAPIDVHLDAVDAYTLLRGVQRRSRARSIR